jgi:galactose mutarotase-like enzyme
MSSLSRYQKTLIQRNALLKDNEETYKEYPFHFEYRVIFVLTGNSLSVCQTAKNLDDKVMICGFGGHPGINVPFGKGQFEDYYLEFSQPTAVKQQLLSENKFMAEKTEAYALEDGVKLPLQHSLFDNDAVILENTSACVIVKSDKESKVVKMRYDDFKYIGFWHACETDAPYVCLEPWSALHGSKQT